MTCYEVLRSCLSLDEESVSFRLEVQPFWKVFSMVCLVGMDEWMGIYCVVFVIANQFRKMLLLTPSIQNESNESNEMKESNESTKSTKQEESLSTDESIFFSLFLILFCLVFMTICFASKNRWYMRGILKTLF